VKDGRIAVLFDIDGTLVDSVYTHVVAWHEAFCQSGLTVPHWEVHRRIGMDGGLLLDELLPLAGVEDSDPRRSELAEDVSEGHSRLYRAAAQRSLRVLPGAREVVKRAKALGFVVVLASSSPQDELELTRGLLDIEEHVDAVTSGEDVDTAKPDATLVKIAIERAGVHPSNAIMVGDATWDAIAATKAGARSVGVLTGGVSAPALRDAGASLVFQDCRDLSRDLENVVQGLGSDAGGGA
jgi:HAD superfamily hydrolase (TIGR01509 family)